MNERESALNLVGAAMPPLKRIDDLYNTAINLMQQSEVSFTTSSAKKSNLGMILAIIAGIFTWEIVGKICGKIMLSLSSDGDLSTSGALFMILFSTVVAIAAFIFVKRFFSKPSKSVTDLAVRNETQIQQISDEIERVAAENAELFDQLPRDYRYYDAVRFFESALTNGRADNMKEAINLFEDELHKMRLENNSQRTLYANEQQCRMLADIEENSRRAAMASEANFVFNVMYYLNR